MPTEREDYSRAKINATLLSRSERRQASKGEALLVLGDIFDPAAELFIREHFRPHWSQTGAVVFITFRTHDSIPGEVLRQWDREKQEWLEHRGYDCARHWSTVLPTLEPEERVDFQKAFRRQREISLDTCHGRCLLRRPELARIVAGALLHFDGQRYRMGDFIVMPTHVHLLAAFATPGAMKDQCDSWLHYTATQINKTIGERGKFWQQEPFDHLVRSLEQYDYLRQYIADNPRKAGLKPDEYLYRRYEG